MTGGNAPLFNQPGWQVNKVYNVAGDLHEGATPADLVAALRQLRGLVAGLDEVAPAQRAEIEADLDGAIEEAGQPEPDRDRVIGRLTRIGERLKALGAAAGASFALLKSVSDIIDWSQVHL
jgi:hypothetical protein